MAKEHVFNFGWLIVEEDDGQVFTLEDVRDLEEAGGNTARHGPFASVEEAKRWIAEEIQAVQELKGEQRAQ